MKWKAVSPKPHDIEKMGALFLDQGGTNELSARGKSPLESAEVGPLKKAGGNRLKNLHWGMG